MKICTKSIKCQGECFLQDKKLTGLHIIGNSANKIYTHPKTINRIFPYK